MLRLTDINIATRDPNVQNLQRYFLTETVKGMYDPDKEGPKQGPGLDINFIYFYDKINGDITIGDLRYHKIKEHFSQYNQYREKYHYSSKTKQFLEGIAEKIKEMLSLFQYLYNQVIIL